MQAQAQHLLLALHLEDRAHGFVKIELGMADTSLGSVCENLQRLPRA